MKKNNPQHLLICISVFCMVSLGTVAQVGINTASPADGTILDIRSSNKGVLLPRIILTATNVQAPVTGTLTNGTIIYNTGSGGAGINAVTPGYYYWETNRWRRMATDGYSQQWFQSAKITPTLTAFTTLPNLEQTITAPFTGTYQVAVTAYFNVGARSSGVASIPQGSQASIKLERNGTKIAENMVSSVGINGLEQLPQQVAIIENVELLAGTLYTFRVSGREWRRTTNAAVGEFGTTDTYTGNGGVTTAAQGSMTITLLRSE